MLGSFTDTDFSPPPPICPSFPTQILIAGSEIPSKGFADFLQALLQIEQSEPDFPSLNCTFTGRRPTDPDAEKLLTHSVRSQFKFKGRVNDFVPFAKNFQLAIHPSRSESFGMAPLELMLAGIPTLVSSTGIIDQLNIPTSWVFEPHNPEELSAKLIQLWKNWPSTAPHLSEVQNKIRKRYHIAETAQQIAHFAKTAV
jgi:glycosyltransferase involved in cell wall biosynthesis